jgi:hypothetical protein
MAEGDYYRLERAEQRKGLPRRMDPKLRKYIQGQRLLCDWLPYEVAPETAVKSPESLYKQLKRIGLTWDSKLNDWRLNRNFNDVVSYFQEEVWGDL